VAGLCRLRAFKRTPARADIECMERSSALLWSAIATVAGVLFVGAFFGTKLAAEAGASARPAGPSSSGRFDRYVAPESHCPRARDGGAPAAVQQGVTLCLINFARSVDGLRPLAPSGPLMRSAELKAGDIARCRDFSHDACGLDVRQRFADVGYFRADASTHFGENLAWGAASAGSPRGALLGWLESDEHRENMLNPDWTEQGVALVYAADFRGVANSRIWVSHFGRQS
jgi:Cysteine-rich secretory protein family